MIFDTHAHYDDKAFDNDRDELLTSLHAQGIELIIDPGCDVESSRMALDIAGRHPFVYAAVGLHPEEAEKFESSTISQIADLARSEKCVAIGEIGLDYYWVKDNAPLQREIFEAQLRLALEMSLPVIIHDREAHGDCLETVKKYPELRGVFHCYSGSAEMAAELIKRGWYLGFDGPVTYKNNKKAAEVLAVCPMERMLIETDSPYLSPVPMRGKRNDSGNLRYVTEKIAEIKGVTAEEIERVTMENGKRLFGI